MRRLAAAVLATLLVYGCATAHHHRMTSWRGFGVGSWPGADWRPYADDSPFNEPIPARVRVHPRSRRIVARILSWGAPASIVAGVSDTSADYAHPTYWARKTDPRYRLRPVSRWSRSPIRGMRIRIPSGARPAAGGDGHMTVVEPDGWEYDFWQARAKPRGGGTLRYVNGSRLRIDGPGLRARGTAAGFGNLAGIVRAPELAEGRIEHALFVVVRCTSATRRFGDGERRRAGDGSYVFPASAGAARCWDGEADAPPTGARLQLAMSDAEIDALDAPPWKKAILTALAHYGGYIGDTGGPGFGIQIESSTTYTAFGYPDPLVELAHQASAAGAGLVAEYGGRYTFDLASGVDWARRLRVVVPPKR